MTEVWRGGQKHALVLACLPLQFTLLFFGVLGAHAVACRST